MKSSACRRRGDGAVKEREREEERARAKARARARVRQRARDKNKPRADNEWQGRAGHCIHFNYHSRPSSPEVQMFDTHEGTLAGERLCTPSGRQSAGAYRGCLCGHEGNEYHLLSPRVGPRVLHLLEAILS